MPVFRWLQAEEAWLEARIIADGGLSDVSNKTWIKSLVSDFQVQFPRMRRINLCGVTETEDEVIVRWQEVPRVSDYQSQFRRNLTPQMFWNP